MQEKQEGVRYTAPAGTHYTVVVREMVSLANARGLPVSGTFNNVSITVSPRADVGMVAAHLHDELRRPAREWEDSPEFVLITPVMDAVADLEADLRKQVRARSEPQRVVA